MTGASCSFYTRVYCQNKITTDVLSATNFYKFCSSSTFLLLFRNSYTEPGWEKYIRDLRILGFHLFFKGFINYYEKTYYFLGTHIAHWVYCYSSTQQNDLSLTSFSWSLCKICKIYIRVAADNHDLICFWMTEIILEIFM